MNESGNGTATMPAKVPSGARKARAMMMIGCPLSPLVSGRRPASHATGLI
jgi:hypothetical protein